MYAAGWDYVGAELARVKVQLCGRLAVSVDGRRVEDELPGRQGRLLFAFLTLNRLRTLTRDELVEALWPDGRDGGLAPLLSKLRRVVPLDGLRLRGRGLGRRRGRGDALHRAESALAQGDPHAAWGPVAGGDVRRPARPFLADEDCALGRRRAAPRSASCTCARSRRTPRRRSASAAPSSPRRYARAESSSRREPYRESGYRILIEALDRGGQRRRGAPRLRGLATKLRDDLGITPSDPTQELYRRLLG